MVWAIFEDIVCKTPHASKNEQELREKLKKYISKIVKEQNIAVEIFEDTRGNILFSFPATIGYESKPSLLFQAHLDMVCESDLPEKFDFNVNPLRLTLSDDHTWIKAIGTTLGADDGIGIALALGVVLQSNLKFIHGPIEVLFTVEEELGLLGARDIISEQIPLKSQLMINLDSGELNRITIGSAGTARLTYRKKLNMLKNESNQKSFFKLGVEGLLGGHSGADIDLPRGNAIKINSRILRAVNERMDIYIGIWEGGTRISAITRTSHVIFGVNIQDEHKCQSIITEQIQSIKDYYRKKSIENMVLEPQLQINLSKVNFNSHLSAIDSQQIIQILNILPHGIQQFSPFYPDTKQTSSNVAIINITEGQVEIVQGIRGNLPSELRSFVHSMLDLAKLTSWEVESVFGSPSWIEDSQNRFINRCKSIYERISDYPVTFRISHGALEPSYLKTKFPIGSVISIGPTIQNMHTPQEMLHIRDVKIIYDVLSQIILDFAEN